MAMLRWLAESLKEARTAAGLVQAEVAAHLPVERQGRATHAARISNFEAGKSDGKGGRHYFWPTDPDVIVAAYAKALSREEFDLWAAALSRWAAAEKPVGDEARDLLDTLAAAIPGLVEASSHAESHRPGRPKQSRGRSRRK